MAIRAITAASQLALSEHATSRARVSQVAASAVPPYAGESFAALTRRRQPAGEVPFAHAGVLHSRHARGIKVPRAAAAVHQQRTMQPARRHSPRPAALALTPSITMTHAVVPAARRQWSRAQSASALRGRQPAGLPPSLQASSGHLWADLPDLDHDIDHDIDNDLDHDLDHHLDHHLDHDLGAPRRRGARVLSAPPARTVSPLPSHLYLEFHAAGRRGALTLSRPADTLTRSLQQFDFGLQQ